MERSYGGVLHILGRNMESGKFMGDWQWLINLGAGTMLTAVGWFIKSVRADSKDLQAELTAFRLEVAKDYVTHTDLADIKNTLFRIETKLDAKQDK